MDMGLKLKNRKVWFTAYIAYFCRFAFPLVPLLGLLYAEHDIVHLPFFMVRVSYPLSWCSCLISVHATTQVTWLGKY